MPSHARRIFAAALVAAAATTGCSSSPSTASSTSTSTSTSIPNTPTHLALISGSNQAGAISAALAAPLVVEALDGASRPVAGVQITWTVTGGGSVSAASGTTNAAGLDSVTWTLGPAPAVQAATATSSAITGASVAFIATNGATIVGSVTSDVPPQGMFAAARSAAPRKNPLALSLTASARPTGRRASRYRIVVGFRSDVLKVDASGSATYRSMAFARSTATVLQARAATLMQQQPLTEAEVSPAMLAVRFRVPDSTKVDSVIAALSANPAVAWVTRDNVMSAWTLTTKHATPPFLAARAGARGYAPASVATKLPNAGFLYAQYWSHNMVDLPRAWAITTGSAAVTVAVVDMGIRPTSPDIAANLTSDGYDFVSSVPVTDYGYSSPQSICLPDGSGRVIGTFTTFSEDSGPHADPTDPDDLSPDPNFNCWDRSTSGDHGLWTAGIIGATGTATASNTGFVGVNWNVKIRAIRVLDASGSGEVWDIAQGILYAAGLPAHSGGCVATASNGGGCLDSAATTALVQTTRAPIINLSLGGGSDPVLQSAINAASNAGCLIVASAGNNSSDFADAPAYPAGYPNVMAVTAVGPSGSLASYANDGLNISVAAPGGDFQLDDNSNGGGGVIGPGWDFVHGVPAVFDADGTSASAPYVSGIAALLLAQSPGLSAASLQNLIQQYATRAATAQRNDSYGWGIVDAYNALTQTAGPKRQTYVRVLDANSGAVVAQTAAAANGSFSLTQLPAGSYVLQAGEDESGDATIGTPGRRFGWAGGVASPTVFTVTVNQAQAQTAAIAIGLPMGSEPNGTTAGANAVSVAGYVAGLLTVPNQQDVYKFNVPASGQYTLETSGVIGSCGLGIEMGTVLTLQNSSGTTLATSNAELAASLTGPFCSKISTTLSPGTYYAIVSGSTTDAANYGIALHGQYRLQVRAGP